MKNPEKANKVAGSDVKVLPVDDEGGATEKNLPQWTVSPARSADNRGSDLNLSAGNGDNQFSLPDQAALVNLVDLPSLADARLRAVERAHDMMALHAMRLVESNSDTLSVVIKPAVGTELSLELRQHADGIEAHATLTRGDGEFLNRHWADLQQRLEQRGIKLAPLGGETAFSSGEHHSFKQQPSPEEYADQASAFAEFAVADGSGGASARASMIHDGWESWA